MHSLENVLYRAFGYFCFCPLILLQEIVGMTFILDEFLNHPYSCLYAFWYCYLYFFKLYHNVFFFLLHT